MQANLQNLRRLTLKEVEKIVKFKKSKIYKKIKEGTFPRPHHDGRNAFWFEADILNYLSKFKHN